jgi:hypothetical protein
MNGGPLVTAWLVGEGIMVYRTVEKDKRPPLPGELLATSGLFLLLGLLSEASAEMAALLAWGFDLAAFMNLAPSLFNTTGAAAAKGGAAGAGANVTAS